MQPGPSTATPSASGRQGIGGAPPSKPLLASSSALPTSPLGSQRATRFSSRVSPWSAPPTPDSPTPAHPDGGRIDAASAILVSAISSARPGSGPRPTFFYEGRERSPL